MKNFLEMAKFEKISTVSENFMEIGGNLKQGVMHHCLKGMDAPANLVTRPLSKTLFSTARCRISEVC